MTTLQDLIVAREVDGVLKIGDLELARRKTEKSYKVEMKGSLFEVTFENGSYSDYQIITKVFSGNTVDEVWEYVKIFTKEGGLGDVYESGIEFEGKRFQFTDTKKEINWYGYYIFEVQIKRLNVIYVTP